MEWTRPFFAIEHPLDTINRWLNLAYGVVLIVLTWQIGLSFFVVLLFIALMLLHYYGHQLPAHRLDTPYRASILLLLEFVLLLLLTYGEAGERVSTIFLIFTALVMLNHPAWVALPVVYGGYLLYLVLFEWPRLTVGTVLLSLINFSLLPLALAGVRLLAAQRQQILQLNQRLQSQTALLVEMGKLRERNRLAEAMHDTMGHTLTSAIVALEGAALLLQPRPAEAISLLDGVRAQLQSSLGDIRQTVRTLKTDLLAEQATLGAALEQLVERVSRQTGVAIALQNQLTVDLLPIQAYVLYAIVQESITNALKHSQATHMQITLAAVADEFVTLTLVDNGVGTNVFAPGFGLTHLEQKVKALGGAWTIDTGDQVGFRLEVLLPLTADVAVAKGNKTERDD